MIMSMSDKKFSYIGMTNSLRQRIQQHNTGLGSSTTAQLHLRPFALVAYICGFERNRYMMFRAEAKWKLKRDCCIRNGIFDVYSLANCANEVIHDLMNTNTHNSFQLLVVFLMG